MTKEKTTKSGQSTYKYTKATGSFFIPVISAGKNRHALKRKGLPKKSIERWRDYPVVPPKKSITEKSFTCCLNVQMQSHPKQLLL